VPFPLTPKSVPAVFNVVLAAAPVSLMKTSGNEVVPVPANGTPVIFTAGADAAPFALAVIAPLAVMAPAVTVASAAFVRLRSLIVPSVETSKEPPAVAALLVNAITPSDGAVIADLLVQLIIDAVPAVTLFRDAMALFTFSAPAMPTPPATTSAPVIEFVDAVAFVTVTIPLVPTVVNAPVFGVVAPTVPLNAVPLLAAVIRPLASTVMLENV